MYIQTQTPEQRKRNAKFTKQQDLKRGKPETDLKVKKAFKSPVSPVILGRFMFSLSTNLPPYLPTSFPSPLSLTRTVLLDAA